MTGSPGPRAPKSALAGIRAVLRGAEIDEAPALFERFCDESRARQDKHLERIRSEAWRLGLEVGSYRLTLVDAQARLERLCDQLDPEVTAVPLRRVPFALGRAAAKEAFDAGMSAVKKAQAA